MLVDVDDYNANVRNPTINLPFLEGLYYVSAIHLLSIVMLGMIYWWVYYIN